MMFEVVVSILVIPQRTLESYYGYSHKTIFGIYDFYTLKKLLKNSVQLKNFLLTRTW